MVDQQFIVCQRFVSLSFVDAAVMSVQTELITGKSMVQTTTVAAISIVIVVPVVMLVELAIHRMIVMHC